jgi:plasmid stabilization system protein ParE
MNIVWHKPAFQSFTRELIRIRKRSVQRADALEKELISAIEQLSKKPELCAPDRFMRGNKGDFRLFQLYGLNISYFVDREYGIFILRVLHWRRRNK